MVKVKLNYTVFTMQNALNGSIVVIGIGEIGSVIARAFLRTGRPVIPVTRDMDVQQKAKQLDAPEAVVVAVGETALETILEAMPEVWKDRLILIQNELLPNDWQKYQLDPTVISVWFEKKKGQDVKVVVSSPIYGKHAKILGEALQELDIPITILDTPAQLEFELVRKNLYILVTNLAGLKVGGTVNELWNNHRDLAQAVFDDVLSIQEYLVGKSLDKESLKAAMLTAFEGDPDHQCMGRSAPARLKRALEIADKAGLEVPSLRSIQA